MLCCHLRIDWQLALGCTGHPYRSYTPRHGIMAHEMRTQWHEIRSLETGTFSIVQEALSSLRLVKAFGQEERERDRFLEQASVGAEARLRAAWSESLLGMVVGLTTGVATALVLYIGIKRVQAGSVTLGDLLLVMALPRAITGPARDTQSNDRPLFQNSLASAERAFALLDQPPDVAEQPHAIRLT